ncbi:restriction endonuclease [Lysobacter fragariae]
MLTAASITIALGVVAAVGGAASAWVWLVQRPRVEREDGLRLLAAMRWREFSKMVVDALHSQGYKPEAAGEAAERGQDSVLHLVRNESKWLLACKQGNNYKVTTTVVGDMADAIRFHGAAGGVVATPGSADKAARKLGEGRIDIIDGEGLWPLIRSQLAPGVREEIWAKSRHGAVRQTTIAWAGALTLGLLIAVLMPAREETHDNVASTASAAAPANPAAAATATAPLLAPLPVSEDEQRNDVIQMVSTLPGVEKALWTTRSTLMVYLADENADPVDGICQVMKKYDGLRTSRLHLQPPAGATRPARFLQCATY